MLTRSQRITVKMAQRMAALPDAEYREAWQTIAGPGITSSTDPKLNDRHFDKILSYMEAIYWRKVDQGQLARLPKKPFLGRDYWAHKNEKGNTSRDRYTAPQLVEQIQSLEEQLNDLGYHQHYCAKILESVSGDQQSKNPFILRRYAAALTRTLNAKKRKVAA